MALGDADGGDFSSITEHANVGLANVGGDAKGGKRVDDGVLESTHIAGDGQLARAQGHDGIANQLPRTVVGDQSAAGGLVDLDTFRPQLGRRGQHIIERTSPAESDDRRVLEKQKRIWNLLAETLLYELILKTQRIRVRDAPEVLDRKRVNEHRRQREWRRR